MILLSGFLEVFLKALVLIGLVSAVGGTAFALFVLRPVQRLAPAGRAALRNSLVLVAFGGILLVFAQLAVLLIEPWALADELGRWPISQFLATHFARAALFHACTSLALTIAALWLMAHRDSNFGWGILIALSVLLMGSGAWLVHAVSRLEHTAALMTATVLHQLGASLWIGGLLQLVFLWRLIRGTREEKTLWPRIVGQFSPMAMLSVSLLVATGLYLSLIYIGTPQGLVGTAYGTMVLTKVALLGFALCLGGLTFLGVRRWKREGDPNTLCQRGPAFMETEMLIGVLILLAAAALTSQPPAVDVSTQQATPLEVLQVFVPKKPLLIPPPYREMLSQASSSLNIFAVSGTLDKMQSNFNHNVSGLFVILTGLCAMMNSIVKVPLIRHWPLLFLPLSLFLLLFAEPTGWPLGTEGFWETLIVPGVLQHRLATLLVAGLALFEWRVRAGRLADTRWRFAWPLLCIVGGALLLTHSHTAFADKKAFLIEVSHNAIGFLAVVTGAARWLELRLPLPVRRVPGVLWTVCMILVGFVLLFYREV